MSLDSRLRDFHAEDEVPNLAESLATVKAKARRKIVLRRVGMTAIAAAIVAAAIAVPIAISDRTTDPITPVPQPSPSVSFHAATPTDHARLVAYVAQNDLWVYDVDADRSTRLTSGGEENREDDLAFYGDGYVLYSSSDPTGIQAIRVSGGPSITIVEEQGTILDFDVSPDGATIVYIQVDHEADSTHRLKRRSINGEAAVVLRELGVPPGRGAGSEDEVSVAWSRDGRSILVTDTHLDLDPRASILWLDAEGKNVVAPWSGTHAQWSPDGKTIFYRGYAGLGDSRWRALEIATKSKRTMGFREGSNNLVISPDGSSVAYDTSWFGDTPGGTVVTEGEPIVYVYDLRSGRETLLKSGSVFPIWITPDLLIATDATPPKSGRTLNSWEPTGTVTKLGLDGASERVSISSTAWTAAALFDE